MEHSSFGDDKSGENAGLPARVGCSLELTIGLKVRAANNTKEITNAKVTKKPFLKLQFIPFELKIGHYKKNKDVNE
jgi:hypothetical protein